ncbi:MAG TPA: 16S rRNA (cytosine(967)-C(5))-methyltransferase RsmB [Candidatus Jeotgalibaca pullicola]|nr:16S rRNA (cytosine(967)-C(5))-methyltransferase RsmB [Candidatus Jeotgalibaca pullicola]
MSKKKTNKIVHSVRYLATEMLDAIDTEGAYSNILLNAIIEKEQLNSADIGLLTELVYGVTQRKLTLDYFLQPFIRKPQKMQSWVINLLRLSVYQIVYLDKIPDHAIFYDAVEIAKQKGHTGIAKLVNGVLRNFQRTGWQDWEEIPDQTKKLSIGASVPEWLVKKFIKDFGHAKAEKLLLSLQHAPYLSLRVQNPEKLDEIREALEKEGIETERSPISPVGLRVKSGKVTHSSFFKKGAITIQDESSQLVALFGKLEKADAVLDACAAPGGKTIHMASFLDEGSGGTVHALDIHEHKIQLIEENARRMNVSNRINTHLLDAKQADTQFSKEQFDVVFVDAPCSGLGLMRRKPEIKYVVTKQGITSLQEEQYNILTAVEQLVRKGGRLVYSTCTLAREENQEIVEKFLTEHPNYRVLPANSAVNENGDEKFPSEIVTSEGYIQIFPDDFGTDGFFICVMERVE